MQIDQAQERGFDTACAAATNPAPIHPPCPVTTLFHLPPSCPPFPSPSPEPDLPAPVGFPTITCTSRKILAFPPVCWALRCCKALYTHSNDTKCFMQILDHVLNRIGLLFWSLIITIGRLSSKASVVPSAHVSTV